MPCRVAHLTSVHHAFDTRIFHKQCKSLAAAGYEVSLIAPRAEGDISQNGVKLRAIAPAQNRRERMMRSIWKVYEAALSENAEIYHFHDPELMPIGALLRLRGKRVIYDVHEDYTSTMCDKKWLPPILRWPASVAVRLCEVTIARVYDRVVAATPTIAKKFPATKTRLVQNFPWTNELPLAESKPYADRDAVVAYVGWLADSRGLREMTEAIRLVSTKMPVRLVTGGKVIPGAKAESYEECSELIEHRGQINRAQVASLLAQARVGLVVFHPTGNYVNAQPTKLFEYMSAGLPVVASDFPIWKQIVESAKSGLVVNPLDPTAIAGAISWLLSHPAEAAAMGRNGQRAVAEHYNWEREADRLIATYAELWPSRNGIGHAAIARVQ